MLTHWLVGTEQPGGLRSVGLVADQKLVIRFGGLRIVFRLSDPGVCKPQCNIPMYLALEE